MLNIMKAMNVAKRVEELERQAFEAKQPVIKEVEDRVGAEWCVCLYTHYKELRFGFFKQGKLDDIGTVVFEVADEVVLISSGKHDDSDVKAIAEILKEWAFASVE